MAAIPCRSFSSRLVTASLRSLQCSAYSSVSPNGRWSVAHNGMLPQGCKVTSSSSRRHLAVATLANRHSSLHIARAFQTSSQTMMAQFDGPLTGGGERSVRCRDAVIEVLEEGIAADINVIDQRSFEDGALTDFMICCTVKSERHFHALSRRTLKMLKADKRENWLTRKGWKVTMDGHPDEAWGVINAGEVWVNFFTPEGRLEHALLEKAWADPQKWKNAFKSTEAKEVLDAQGDAIIDLDGFDHGDDYAWIKEIDPAAFLEIAEKRQALEKGDFFEETEYYTTGSNASAGLEEYTSEAASCDSDAQQHGDGLPSEEKYSEWTPSDIFSNPDDEFDIDNASMQKQKLRASTSGDDVRKDGASDRKE